MFDTKPRQHLAVVAIANCSICHGEGFRYNNPNAKPDCLAACQITAGWRTSCACSSSLSGIRCRIVAFSFQIHSDFIVHLWADLLLVWHESDYICIPKTSSPSLRSTDLQGRALSLSPLPKLPKPRSQSMFVGEAPDISFHPLSHKIPPCAVRGSERIRASASVTEPHQGHTNITSVQLPDA